MVKSKVTYEKFLELAHEKYGDTYDYSFVEYVNYSTKVLIRCKDHGIFLKSPTKHIYGQGCPNISHHDTSRKNHICTKCNNSYLEDCICLIKVNCNYCKNDFYANGQQKTVRKYCSLKCRKLTKRERNKNKKLSMCDLCGQHFISSSRRRCETHYWPCSFCEKITEKATKRIMKYFDDGIEIFCDNICQLFKHKNPNFNLSKLDDFKDQKSWAINWKKSNGRKPTRMDFLEYFNLASTTNFNSSSKNYFAKSGTSRWESIVLAEIQKHLPEDVEILQNKKPIKLEGSKKLQLDIWIPELKLAFEVQDFATHSKISDEEKSELQGVENSKRFKKLKNGPSYHELKKNLAKDQLDTIVIEIWEDEIIDGTFKEIVVRALKDN